MTDHDRGKILCRCYPCQATRAKPKAAPEGEQLSEDEYYNDENTIKRLQELLDKANVDGCNRVQISSYELQLLLALNASTGVVVISRECAEVIATSCEYVKKYHGDEWQDEDEHYFSELTAARSKNDR